MRAAAGRQPSVDRSVLRRQSVSSIHLWWLRIRAAIGSSVPAAVVFAAMLFAGLTGYGAYRWMSTRDRFSIKRISVSGTTSVPPARVLNRANTVRGKSVFQLDLEHLATEIAADPWIANAVVTRDYPDGLHIAIEEHDAAALVRLEALYFVNDLGIPFKRVNSARDDVRGLPVITGIDRQDFVRYPGQARARLREALVAWRAYAIDTSRPPIGEIALDEFGRMWFVTVDTAMSIDLGTGAHDHIAGILNAFDRVWATLAPAERLHAVRVRIAAGDRATVSFSGS